MVRYAPLLPLFLFCICILVISVDEHVARRQRGAMVRSAPPYFLRLPANVRGQNILILYC